MGDWSDTEDSLRLASSIEMREGVEKASNIGAMQWRGEGGNTLG